MKKKPSVSAVMVSVSVFAFAGLCAYPVFAQVIVSCNAGLSIGQNAQCSSNAKLVINPDGSTNLTSGCLITTTPGHAAHCVLSTGGAAPSKSVQVDFAKTFVNIKNGAKQVRVDNLLMQYKTSIPAASKFTFSPTAVADGIDLKIGGTANVTTAGQGLGTYTGNITIRAN